MQIDINKISRLLKIVSESDIAELALREGEEEINDKVEILEEEKKIPEKLNPAPCSDGSCHGSSGSPRSSSRTAASPGSISGIWTHYEITDGGNLLSFCQS